MYALTASALGLSAQDPTIDSLKGLLQRSLVDTTRANVLNELSYEVFGSEPNQAIQYGQEALALSEQAGYAKGAAYAMKHIGLGHYMLGNYVEVLDFWIRSLQVFEDMDDQLGVANMVNNLGAVYYNQGNDLKAIEYYLRSLQISESLGDTLRIATALLNTGGVYANMPQNYTEALRFYWRALPLAQAIGDDQATITCAVNLGDLYLRMGNYDSALYYLEGALNSDDPLVASYAHNQLGAVYRDLGEYAKALDSHDESFQLAKGLDQQLEMAQALIGKGETLVAMQSYARAIQIYHAAEEMATEVGLQGELESAYQGLAEAYSKTGNFERAYHYRTLFSSVKDALFDQKLSEEVSGLQLSYEIDKKQQEIDILAKSAEIERLEANRQRTISMATGITGLLVLILAIVLAQRYRLVNHTNKLIAAEKDREAAQAREIEKAYEELKTTQSQLIQSEKMASLGELTAGIAHEIQNPLNFVNNFSELNQELIDELRASLASDNEEDVEALLKDLADNEKKIRTHGGRAEGIIKGMLQHSRSGNGEKEPTDINALAEEYLRLAYHGLKAKDQSFNADFTTALDSDLPRVDVVPQDIGRVLLNLINNAFAAVSEKARSANNGYQPTVQIRTNRSPLDGEEGVSITVSDNGSGIPRDIRDKIFQPFFTTKPAGSGTGLGLSLSYDIVTKGHGGTLEMQTREGEGTEFSINLPISGVAIGNSQNPL